MPLPDTRPGPRRGAPCIGIVGGVGPYAGLDLHAKIVEQTQARGDGEHLPVLHLSCAAQIPDRTAFLSGRIRVNPAAALASQILRLERAGAVVAGIPCNTAHAPPIFDELAARLAAVGCRLRLLHMIEAAAELLRTAQPHLRRVGLLATLGTYASRVYEHVFSSFQVEILCPDEIGRQALADAIYSQDYGIKARGAHPRARAILLAAVDELHGRGAQAVILGCSEIPVCLQGNTEQGLPLLDPTLALARALIRAFRPGRLRPLERTRATV